MTEWSQPPSDASGAPKTPTPAQIKRWRKNLAEERAEGAVYHDLARKRDGEEAEILRGLAEAEKRHEQHWLHLLGTNVGMPIQASFRTRVLAWFARRFGSVFALALMQGVETRSRNIVDADASTTMQADERMHGEVVRALAARGRTRMSGTFRAAIFGANDGLVSNLALVMGIGATGASPSIVLFTGITGLVAGALSMGAGEYVSVRSQRELLEASIPDQAAMDAVHDLDVDANELSLVYRARGMSEEEAVERAAVVLSRLEPLVHADDAVERSLEQVGTGANAAISSFVFFSMGAIIPVIPWIIGLHGMTAIVAAAILVGVALLVTGGLVGVLSGASPTSRALRQLGIGYGAAAVTYGIGTLAGGVVG